MFGTLPSASADLGNGCGNRLAAAFCNIEAARIGMINEVGDSPTDVTNLEVISLHITAAPNVDRLASIDLPNKPAHDRTTTVTRTVNTGQSKDCERRTSRELPKGIRSIAFETA